MSGLLEAVLALVQQDALEALVRVLHSDYRVIIQPLVHPLAQLRIPWIPRSQILQFRGIHRIEPN